MESDPEAERLSVNSGSDEEEDSTKWQRPPSSYGSMKSDSVKTDEELMEDPEEMAAAAAAAPDVPAAPDAPAAQEETGMRLIRSESPETLYTITTMQTKPPGAQVLETRSDDSLECPEDEEEEDEDDDDGLIANSPEPPEVIVPECSMQTDENGQPGRLHQEQDLPHIFKSIQSVLSGLSTKEFYNFRVTFRQWERKITKEDVMDDDVLNFVDKIIEVLGRDESLRQTIRCLDLNKNDAKAEELRNLCKRALNRYTLTSYYIRRHEVIHEGIIRAGGQRLLRQVYVEPELSTSGFGAVDPAHELREPPPPSFQLPAADTFVNVSNLFRLQKADGTPLRTLVTTGLPGSGMTVSVGKFVLDWAEEKANRDIQFVIKISFMKLWSVRKRKLVHTDKVSMMDVFKYWYPDYRRITYLEESQSVLVVMDSFDCYHAPLDWENAPVVTGLHTEAHPDILVVNIIRGNLFPGARLWILGRRAAVTQIPSQFVDIFTELQGFDDEMKEAYLIQQIQEPALAQKIVTYFKRLPALVRLARHPFVCWMVAAIFKQCYHYLDFGEHRPRLTPFYISLMLVQMNRRLQFYYDQLPNMRDQDWSAEDQNLLLQMGKMALKMLERNTGVFCEDEVKQYGWSLTEVTVFSGMCTELPADAGRRQFCFLHFQFQEFLAALYVFLTFRMESKNVLESGIAVSVLALIHQSKSAAHLLQCAITRTLSSRLGHYDMFLRFLCGLLNPDCHNQQLCGYMYPHNIPKMSGLDKAAQLLRQTIQNAPAERLENLKECLREMTQEDS